MKRTILVTCSCLVALAGGSPSLTNLSPLMKVITLDGRNVTIFEHGDSGGYYFSPSAVLLRRDSANAECDGGRHGVSFVVDLWNEDVLDELESLTGISKDLLTVYPAESVKLAGPTRYTLPRKGTAFSSTSQSAKFCVLCKKEDDCEELLQKSRTNEANLGFELQVLHQGSEALSVVTSVSVANHVVRTSCYEKIVDEGVFYLTEAGLDQLAEEVADQVLAEVEKESGMYTDFSSPQDAIETIKAGLAAEKVNPTSASDWNTKVTWGSEVDQNARLEMVAEALNDAFWESRGRGAMPSGGGPSGLTWLLAVFASFSVEWTGNNIQTETATLYAVNATKLASLDTIGNVTVDLYPLEAIFRIPVVLSKISPASSRSKRKWRHYSFIFGSPLYLIVLATIITPIVLTTYSYRFRRRRVIVPMV